MEIPPSFLAKIISQLSIAGLIHTSRGARGGVSLARKPGDVSLLDVVEAIDGPITLNDCTEDPDICTFGDNCPLHEVWCETQAELVRRLQGATFDKLLEREAKNSPNNHKLNCRILTLDKTFFQGCYIKNIPFLW